MEKIEKYWVYTNTDLKQWLSKSELKRFHKWMIGQTGLITSDGDFGYFHHDVDRFIKLIRHKIPTYFD